MLVLDLDLDFFIDPIAYNVSGSDRLDDEQYRPWTEGAFRVFLENQCGLTTGNPRPGRVFREHHEAFFWWRNLIRNEKLRAPFHVVHVDAHADLGAGAKVMESLHFLSTELVLWELPARQFPEFFLASHFGPANFLAFAIGCRWLNSLTYVTHPHWQRNRDLPPFYFQDERVESGWIQLKAYSKRDFPSPAAEPPSGEALHKEPRVKFEAIPGTDLRLTRAPDFVTLSQSPGYTPPRADELIPIFEEYIFPV